MIMESPGRSPVPHALREAVLASSALLPPAFLSALLLLTLLLPAGFLRAASAQNSGVKLR